MCSHSRNRLAAALSTLILTALLLNAFAPSVGKPARVAQVAEPADPLLVVLNQAFRDAYGRARQEAIAASGPVILVEGDNLVLIRDGKRSEVKVIPEAYHVLKAVSHVPLALHVMLAPGADREISDTRLAELRSFLDKLPAAEKSLEGRGLSDTVLRRQQEMFADSRLVLEGVLYKKKIVVGDLLAFTRRQAPLMMANAADAARAQLDAMHKQVTAWQAEMPAEEWGRVSVVIMGSARRRR